MKPNREGEEYAQIVSLLQKTELYLSENEIVDRPPSHEALVDNLSRRVLALLRDDYCRLLNILYRIDVPEAALGEALTAPTLPEAAQRLAEAILRRLAEKLRYRQGKG